MFRKKLSNGCSSFRQKIRDVVVGVVGIIGVGVGVNVVVVVGVVVGVDFGGESTSSRFPGTKKFPTRLLKIFC